MAFASSNILLNYHTSLEKTSIEQLREDCYN